MPEGSLSVRPAALEGGSSLFSPISISFSRRMVLTVLCLDPLTLMYPRADVPGQKSSSCHYLLVLDRLCPVSRSCTLHAPHSFGCGPLRYSLPPTCRARYPTTYVNLLIKLDMLRSFMAFDMYRTCVSACRDASVARSLLAMIELIVFNKSRLHPPVLLREVNKG